jgi:hypothetical protein
MAEMYYTPCIEDIRIGYECEKRESIYDNTLKVRGTGEWEKITVDITGHRNRLGRLIHFYPMIELRVPFLTKEQIEAEGWKYTGRGTDIWFKKEGIILRDDGHHFTEIVLQYGLHDHRLAIRPKFVGGEEDKFFEGECKDINTFRLIMKLLYIK